MKNIVIPIGLPRSGKSYLSKEYEDEGYIILGRDKIREKLHGTKEDHSNEGKVTDLFNKELDKLLAEGKDIFIDNTNLSYKYRKVFYDKASAKEYTINIIIVNTPIDTILERCEFSNFPKEVINKMLSSYNYFNIDYKELQDNMNVKIINAQEIDYDNFWEYYTKKYENYSQDSVHHSLTLTEHLWSTFENLENYNTEIQLAGLFHDVGKPYTKKFKENGDACYYDHHHYSAYKIYTELKVSNINKEKILLLIRHHMCWFMQGDKNKYFDKLKESFKRFDVTREELEILHEADKSAH